jgi:hypothetical protein
MKANPWPLIRAHYRTFVDYRDGSDRLRDYAFFLGVPAAVWIAACALRVQLPDTASAALLTTSGLLAGFFFGVMLQIATRSASWASEKPEPSKETSHQADFLEEIAANAGYASLVSIVTAATFAIAIAVGPQNAVVIFSGLGLALVTHLILMLCMVMVRVLAWTHDRLVDAKTGHGRIAAVPDQGREAV